jgi:hypothetical protein
MMKVRRKNSGHNQSSLPGLSNSLSSKLGQRKGSYLLLVYFGLFSLATGSVAWFWKSRGSGVNELLLDAQGISYPTLLVLKQRAAEIVAAKNANANSGIPDTTINNDAVTTPNDIQATQQEQEETTIIINDNNNNDIILSPPTLPKTTITSPRTVCVFSSNPRTASIFKTQVMKRYGGGVFDYKVESHQRICRERYPDAPLVGMLYQKSLSQYTSKSLNTYIDSLDAFIIMGDEMCNTPAMINAKVHGRQYYSQHYVDYLTHNPSENLFSTVYLPLGPRFEFQSSLSSYSSSSSSSSDDDDDEIPIVSKRKLLFNLIVSPTSLGRKRLAEQLQNDLTQGVYEPSRVFIHITPAFRNNISESEGFIPPDKYKSTLLSSIFTLCPAGKNPEAYRIFEAIESGSIPVLALDDEYNRHPCKDAFGPFRETNAPFLFIKSWSDLEQELDHAMKSDIESRQRDLFIWYNRFWRDVTMSFECLLNERYRNRIGMVDSSSLPGETDYIEPSCREQDDDDDDDHNNNLLLTTTKQQQQQLSLTKKKSTMMMMVIAMDDKGKPVWSTPLITGCGRTGTLSLADFLNDHGIPAVHERMEKGTVSVSWLYAYPDVDLYPFESSRDVKLRKSLKIKTSKSKTPLFGPVIHIVRHPLKVISSTRRCFCGRGTRTTNRGERSDKKSWIFVEKQLGNGILTPSLPFDSIKRSMIYWYYWNMKILDTTRKYNHGKDVFFRIEDLNPQELVTTLGFTPDVAGKFPNKIPRDDSNLRHVSPLAEKEKLPDVTWKDLFDTDKILANKIFILAKRFGYFQEKDTLTSVLMMVTTTATSSNNNNNKG